MSLTCCDCGAAISRPHNLGAKPKRCLACKKLHVAFKARQWRNANLEHARALERARRPKKAHVVHCTTCNRRFEAQRPHAKHCSRACKNTSRSRPNAGRHSHTCLHCKKPFKCERKKQQYCSTDCMHRAQRKRVTATCARKTCGNHFEALRHEIERGRSFCCRECSYHEPLVCQNPKCGKQFRMKHRTNDPWKNQGKYCCPECYRDHRWGSHRPRQRRSQNARRIAGDCALATSLRKRCKQFNVTFDPACTRRAVLDRDGWVCQKCRAVCNKDYLLDEHTKAPHDLNAEHDHIIPLSVLGSPGNVFENSQCLCRKCNNKKRNKPEGQLRLCLEEEAWGKGVRVRRQQNLSSSEAIRVAAL